MKAVMLSVKPLWCKKILAGEKTLEIRKRRPQTDIPFKCYIYCTTGEENWINSEGKRMSKHIIAEFVCDDIIRFSVPYPAYQQELDRKILEESQVPYYALHRYALQSNDCNLYGWHISDLKVYDESLELNSFLSNTGDEFKFAPQSWCYCIKKPIIVKRSEPK